MKPAYEPKNWETPNCPVCHGNKREPYERFGDRLQYQYVLCKTCQLVYLSPRPRYDDDFVHAAYEHYGEDNFMFQTNENEEVAYRFQKNPDSEARDILRFDKKHAALLDVGCAMGTFLAAAKPHFQKVYGLEVSRSMAAFVERKLGVQVFTQKFEDLETDQKFSAIFMSHVIEHIPDPHRWLQKAKTLLKPDGVLVVCVPNMFSLGRKFKRLLAKIGIKSKNKWDASRTPDHLYEPTLPAFQRLFAENGFEILDSFTYSRSEPIPVSVFGRLFNRVFKVGTNWRFYLRAR